jgi:hypothetical protein
LARGRIAYALIGPLLPIALALCAAAVAEADDVDIRLRLAWGGGEAQSWQGTIQLSAGTLTNVTPLGLEADSPGSMLLVDGATIRIAARTPRSYDGCDIRVQAPADAKLIVRLWAGEMPPAAPLEVPLAKLLGGFAQFDLDQRNNRLLAQRSSGDTLRVKFDRQTLIFEPGDTFELEALPNSLGLTPGASYLLAASLLPAHSEKSMWNEDHELKIDANGQSPQLPVRVLLPTAEGVYDVRLSLYPKRLTTSLVRGTPLATRKVQVVVIAPVQAVSETPVAWQSVLDFDPASPKWWERMARLPSWTP